MPYGTHQVRWDLGNMLYKGAAATHRRQREKLIKAGALGPPRFVRLGFLQTVHESLSAKLERGASPLSFASDLAGLENFYAWADTRDLDITCTTAFEDFRRYAEHLRHRAEIEKSISRNAAFANARRVSTVLATALDLNARNPGAALLRTTRLRRPKKKSVATAAEAQKEDLAKTFAFGRFATDVASRLSLEAIRGPLPLTLELGELGRLVLAPYRNGSTGAREAKAPRRKKSVSRSAPLAPEASTIDLRPSLVNLRIECELALFVAQTGMNLAQACRMRRQVLRWQTDGDDILAFRVFKGRRHGDAVFRAYKVYRSHFGKYIEWLDELLLDGDDRLFPFCYTANIPAEHTLPKLTALSEHCKNLNVPYVPPRTLRHTRVNWLVRTSRDPQLAADMSGHLKETLLGSYAEPHHQSAAAELCHFHNTNDPTLESPGPGVCASRAQLPVSTERNPPAEPDCVNPDGCLFCIYHRDLMTYDYCWKLASHLYLKTIEASLYRPSKNQAQSPAVSVLERLAAKLTLLAEDGAEGRLWVERARNDVRASRFHPMWDGQIALLETFA